ncbi:MAG TPA: TIR domain-containing protein, partial [Ktedonobacterales bacterium]|nr:TIR domain-containing protein [Ktedonobacterales bacterium]
MRLERIAFMSYVHINDDIDNGYLSRLRIRLEGDITAEIGNNFKIFQDNVHITAGLPWEERLKHFISKSTFLLPVVTPHFFNSEWCRKEFEYFRDIERKTFIGSRIIPLYYIDSPVMHDRSLAPDSVERLMSTYQPADWRDLRDRGVTVNAQPAVKRSRRIAKHIADRLHDLETGQYSALNASLLADVGLSGSTQLSSNDATPNAPFDLQILPYPKRVIGRESEVDQVVTALTTPSGSHVFAIDGVTALGKTTVAAIAIRQFYEKSSFPGGIAVVSCTGITDPRIALRDALTRFDPERRPPAMQNEAALAQEAHRLLDKRQALIVLDDVESALDIVRVVTPLHEA